MPPRIPRNWAIPWHWAGGWWVAGLLQEEEASIGNAPAPWYLTEVACEVFTFYMMNIIQSTSFRYRIPPGTTFPSSADPKRRKPLHWGPKALA